MLKFVVVLFLLNFAIICTQSRILPIAKEIDFAMDSQSLRDSPNLYLRLSRSIITDGPLAVAESTTSGPSPSTVEQQLLDIFDVPKSISTTSAPLEGQSSTSDDGVMEEKMVKITFAGRTNFRVRKNCRCIIHGRCSRSDLCD